MLSRIFILFFITILVPQTSCQDLYEIGTGIADITGPAADIGMVSLIFDPIVWF